jgi:hypothetical protein
MPRVEARAGAAAKAGTAGITAATVARMAVLMAVLTADRIRMATALPAILITDR